ncbi:hypothetical protein [Polyangium aurulentum]|uniref:hypothetical protein n=1 Tax=Polyangium aurulentum TaxID=2567896 RepID=UPI0010AE3D9C|nr:hypothetical protein [Polyangium aurulentum]UQA55158.1 hypothetical protein E8A73_027865 [Polyangium aurulentum]
MSKRTLALTLAAGASLLPAASLAQQAAPMPPGPSQVAPMPPGPSQAMYTRYKREVAWGSLGFGPRFATLYNIPRGKFAMGGGVVIRMHPASYPAKPWSYMPVELELEIGYDRYIGDRHYELSYGGSGILHLAGGKVQPYLFASGYRSLGEMDAGRDTRWHLGGGFGVGYRTRRVFLAAQARGGGYVRIGPPGGAEGTVDVKLVGVFYVF